MLALDFLRVAFAWAVLVGVEMTRVGTPIIGSSPSLRPGLSPCTIGQYPSFPVVFISQSKGPALNQLDFVVEALSHAVGIAMPNVAHNRFKPPA